jgi:hypothetical protein
VTTFERFDTLGGIWNPSNTNVEQTTTLTSTIMNTSKQSVSEHYSYLSMLVSDENQASFTDFQHLKGVFIYR